MNLRIKSRGGSAGTIRRTASMPHMPARSPLAPTRGPLTFKPFQGINQAVKTTAPQTIPGAAQVFAPAQTQTQTQKDWAALAALSPAQQKALVDQTNLRKLAALTPAQQQALVDQQNLRTLSTLSPAQQQLAQLAQLTPAQQQALVDQTNLRKLAALPPDQLAAVKAIAAVGEAGLPGAVETGEELTTTGVETARATMGATMGATRLKFSSFNRLHRRPRLPLPSTMHRRPPTSRRSMCPEKTGAGLLESLTCTLRTQSGLVPSLPLKSLRPRRLSPRGRQFSPETCPLGRFSRLGSSDWSGFQSRSRVPKRSARSGQATADSPKIASAERNSIGAAGPAELSCSVGQSLWRSNL